MALLKSAKKAIRSSRRKYVMNLRRKRALHDRVLATRRLVSTSRTDQAESLRLAYQAIDKAAKRGIISKNTAARKKSRLVKFLKTAK